MRLILEFGYQQYSVLNRCVKWIGFDMHRISVVSALNIKINTENNLLMLKTFCLHDFYTQLPSK